MEEGNAMVSRWANLDSIREFIGLRLYDGVQASLMRQGEGHGFTHAISMYVARNEGEDFVLEVWLCSSHGRRIGEETERTFRPFSRISLTVFSPTFCWVSSLVPTLIRPSPAFQDMSRL